MTTKDLQKLRDHLGGIECAVMNGDNLAVTLCTHFDDGEESEDETNWSPAAIAGCNQVLDLIHAFYAAEIAKIRAEAEKDMREKCIQAALSCGNFGDYKREELTPEYGQPRFDMMHSIVNRIGASTVIGDQQT